MSDAAQPLADNDDGPLSRWRMRTIVIVMLVGFTGLVTITMLSYRNAPPIPARVVDAQGATLFNGDDISEDQTVFLKYGLMNNDSIWGHGAYLGPDYSAAALRRMGEDTAEAIVLMMFVLRQTSDDTRWPGIEKYIKVAFWGTNVGLAMMVVMSLFPNGVLQMWDVVQHGYWHARSLGYIGSKRSHLASAGCVGLRQSIFY